MAPPIPVFSASEIKNQYSEQLNNPEKYECHLKSLTQHECTFRPASLDGSRPLEIICLPFKRIFQRCAIPTTTKKNGEKIITKTWINIEVTNSETNQDLFDPNSKYAADVKDFMNTEHELKKFLEQEAEGNL
ncbi:hypothetical protein JA1_001537 [Spathaspora sp. JA1]|nr:hypothetical protein JA1_001537 [Spathaspora sp. JA1]